MCVACDHTIHRAQHHFGWNRDFAPAIRCQPGSTVHFECLDSSGGQLWKDAITYVKASSDPTRPLRP